MRMTVEATLQKLNELKLFAMEKMYMEQLDDPNFKELSFDDRLALMVDGEWLRKQNSRLSRLITNARFRMSDACVEDIHYHEDRKLDKSFITRLSTCNFVSENQNIVIKGASGNGKSYLACALGVSACRNNFSVRYVRLPELLDELAVARMNGTYQKIMKNYRKIKLLILDEWLLVSLNEMQARDLLEIVESRHLNSSTIFCSQFDTSGWYEQIGESTLADAIIDRIIHTSHTVLIDGRVSMRERLGMHS
jgi:DNA replication protein DnaC